MLLMAEGGGEGTHTKAKACEKARETQTYVDGGENESRGDKTKFEREKRARPSLYAYMHVCVVEGQCARVWQWHA